MQRSHWKKKRQIQTALPNSRPFNSSQLKEFALLVGELIKEMESVKEEGEEKLLSQIFFPVPVLKCIYGRFA